MGSRFDRFGLAVILVAISCTAATVSAEAPAEIANGSRVRLTVPGEPRVSGNLHSWDDATLTILDDDHRLVSVRRESLSRLEVASGRKRNWRKGLVIGTLIGIPVSVLAVSVSGAGGASACGGCVADDGDLTRLLVGGALVATYGAMGAGIGALVKTDRWVPVSTGAVTVGVTRPRGNGIGIRLAVTF